MKSVLNPIHSRIRKYAMGSTKTPSKAAFQRPVFPRVSSAIRVIPCRRNGKNRCDLCASKCICGFPRCGGKWLAHQRTRRRHCIRSLERCRDICKGATVRIPPTTSTNLERLEVCPSHTPLEKGLSLFSTPHQHEDVGP
ncbi:hypothetical protein AVEN_206811-1 [Araneus ventricosus]|uniref:Uncharacterized protein n=1 Tax=Araneus ventricosus TaxID=182803 RepID=A0A4Y2C4M3_ARAVE|nr:hypothetical protein AVEN_206811-1 [Araneus ventricosus]